MATENLKLEKYIEVNKIKYDVDAVSATQVDNSLTIIEKKSKNEDKTKSFNGSAGVQIDIVPAAGGHFSGPITVENSELSSETDGNTVLNYRTISTLIENFTGAGWYSWSNNKFNTVTSTNGVPQHFGIVVGEEKEVQNFVTTNFNKKHLPKYIYLCHNTGNLYYGSSTNDQYTSLSSNPSKLDIYLDDSHRDGRYLIQGDKIENDNYGINLKNSDIIGVNGIWFNDITDGRSEGINFLTDTADGVPTKWDRLHARNGTLYLKTGETLNSNTDDQGYTVYHSGTSIPVEKLDKTLPINMGGTGATTKAAAVANLIDSSITLNTGKINFPSDKYRISNRTIYNDSYAINLNNSDILGANTIWFQDNADSTAEGLCFPKTIDGNGSITSWDRFYADNGVLYFKPEENKDGGGTPYTVYHSGTIIPTDNISGTLPVNKGGTGATSKSGAIDNIINGQSISPNEITCSGINVDKITCEYNQFRLSNSQINEDSWAINLNNSDIVNANGIWFGIFNSNSTSGNDTSDYYGEGLNFIRPDNTNGTRVWDRLYALNGTLYFRQGETATSTANGRGNTVYHSGTTIPTDNISGTLPIAKGGTEATTKAGAVANLIDSSITLRPGGIIFGSNALPYANCGIDLNNRDIVNANGIRFSDFCEDYNYDEGILFYRDSTSWDRFYASNGNLYFKPGETSAGNSTKYTIVHTGNIGSQSVNYASSASKATQDSEGWNISKGYYRSASYTNSINSIHVKSSQPSSATTGDIWIKI